MKHTLFEGIIPQIMNGNEIRIGERDYPCPVSDFAISKIDLITICLIPMSQYQWRFC
jgi:mannose-6-phosphate isomerase